MSEVVTAIYENGILKPTRPLALKEHQTVRLRIEEDPVETEHEMVIRLLRDAGYIRQSIHNELQPPDPVSEEERRQLAKALGKASGKSLSEIIIEDRDQR